MTGRHDDLDLAHLFRVVFVQGGQVLLGTAIGAGVLLLVGIIGVLLSPILVPVFLFVHRRQEEARRAAGQDVTALAGGGGAAPPSV